MARRLRATRSKPARNAAGGRFVWAATASSRAAIGESRTARARPCSRARRDRLRSLSRPAACGCVPVAGSSRSSSAIGVTWPPESAISAPLPPSTQIAHRAVAERARVVDVERNRLGAAQFVADVLGVDGRVDADLVEPAAHGVAQHDAERNVGQAHVARTQSRPTLSMRR